MREKKNQYVAIMPHGGLAQAHLGRVSKQYVPKFPILIPFMQAAKALTRVCSLAHALLNIIRSTEISISVDQSLS